MEKRNAFFKSDFTIRENGEKKYIEGYFIIYNQKTRLWKDFYEEIEIGACRQSIKENDVRALFNHNNDVVLGRSKFSTLELSEDSYGVKGKIEINEADKEALNIYERVKRKDITGCSFGFYPTQEEYIENDDGSLTAIVKEANVVEISVCTFPAYPQTMISARQKDYKKAKEKRINIKINKLKERYKNVISNT